MCSLADLMEEHQEELATIETIDSGAVYTLALKTHVGMSIQTFRYFAGWCDKIQVCVCVFTQAFILSFPVADASCPVPRRAQRYPSIRPDPIATSPLQRKSLWGE